MRIWANVGFMLWMAAGVGWAQEPSPDVYTPDALQAIEKNLATKTDAKGLATETLKKYSSDYTMVAFRSQSGQPEQHAKFADFYLVIEGKATIVSGGQMVHGLTTAAGELRGDSIAGGKETKIHQGDLVHIPANIPHQLVLAKGDTLKYFIIKVQEVQ